MRVAWEKKGYSVCQDKATECSGSKQALGYDTKLKKDVYLSVMSFRCRSSWVDGEVIARHANLAH